MFEPSTKLRYLLAESTIDEHDLEELREWLGSNPWLTQGPLVKEFEESWSQWLGRSHSVYVNSGSSANLLMYSAALESGRLKNRKVVVPAVSWSTSVMPAIQLGFEPIMIDAEEETFGIDPDALERVCTEHDPGAVLLVHVLGVPCRMDRILELKERFGFLLLEDNCAAMGSRYHGKVTGTFGDMASFSLYFGHHASTIEGGVVVTDDPQFQELLLMMRSHGWSKDLSPERARQLFAEHGVDPFNQTFTFFVPSYNVRATDLQARIGLAQMKKLTHVFTRRTENHRRYQQRIAAIPHLRCQQNPQAEICSISFMALAESPEHRHRLARAMAVAGIETRPVGGGNMSRQPFWKSRFGKQVFPVADRLHDCAFQLPNHPGLTSDDVDAICDALVDVH